MSKKDCAAGSHWDTLVGACIKVKSKTETRPQLAPTSELPLAAGVLLRPTVQTPKETVLSPALWIFVVLATLGSILALALWFIIYRQQARPSNTSEHSEPQREPLQKTDPISAIHSLPLETCCQADKLQSPAGAPSLCSHHLHLEVQTSSQWEEGFNAYSESTKQVGIEEGRAVPPCNTLREHRIPLPATELGGTALVTTKTV